MESVATASWNTSPLSLEEITGKESLELVADRYNVRVARSRACPNPVGLPNVEERMPDPEPANSLKTF